MLKIALCGTHRSGKTSLIEGIVNRYSIPQLTGVIKQFWRDSGVDDFEKLPLDIRALFQQHLLANQIAQEQIMEGDFVTDRSVLDYWGYTEKCSSMSIQDKDLFRQKIQFHLNKPAYTHFIYVPLETHYDFVPEKLSANLENQAPVAEALEQVLSWVNPDILLTVSGTIKERLEQIYNFIDSTTRT